MQTLPFTEKQRAEIKKVRERFADGGMSPQLEALCLRAEGLPYYEIQKKTGIRANAIRGIVYRYRKYGLEPMTINQYHTLTEISRFTTRQTTEIEAAWQEATDQEVARRLAMLCLYAKGTAVSKIASDAGVSQQTVRRIVSKYKEYGLDVVSGKKNVDRRRLAVKFTPEQIAGLKAALDTIEDKRVKRRFCALLALAEGQAVNDAAVAVGLFPETVRKLYREYRKHGLASLLPTRKVKRKRPFIAHKYNFTTRQKAEIEAACETVTDGREAKKLEALWLRTEKKNLPEISVVTGIHISAIMRLIRKYHEEGLDAIIKDGRKNSGKISSRRYMAYEAAETLLNQLCPPVETARIKKAFEEELGHSVSDAWLSGLLRRHHWHKCSVWRPPEEK